MNGRDKRQERRWRRRAEAKARESQPPCLNGCGMPGPHFMPPSLGQRGFYICTPKEARDA